MSKITIQGVPRQFSADELLAKQQKAVTAYKETNQNLYRLHSSTHGAFFDRYAELVLEGYRPANGRLPDLQAGDYTSYLIKPASIQDEEIAALEHKVKLEYIQSLELERLEFEAKLVAQMLQADEVKRAKAEATKQAKKLEEYKLIASNTWQPLSIPETEQTATI